MAAVRLFLVLCVVFVGCVRGFVPLNLPRHASRPSLLSIEMAEKESAIKIDTKKYNNLAPYISIFSELRGCARESKEYTGPKSGDYNDALCLKIEMDKVSWSKDSAKTLIKELLPTLSPANRKIRGYWKETDE